MRFKPKYVFLDLVPYYCCTVAQQKATCTPYVGELGFKRCKVEVEVVQTFDQNVIQQHMNCGYCLKNKGAGMFCQLSVILTEHTLV